MDQELCGTFITGELLAKRFKETFGLTANLQRVNGEKIAIGQGYWGSIMRLKLKWEKPDHLPSVVIAKTITTQSMNTLMDTTMSNEDEKQGKMKELVARALPLAHDTECTFYRILGHKPPIPVPKHYVLQLIDENGQGMIVMEDLSEKASVFPDDIKGLSYAQSLSAISAIAHLQAWSLTTSVDWKNHLQSLPDRELFAKGWYNNTAKGLQAAKKQYPDHFGSIDLEKLLPWTDYDKAAEIFYEHRNLMDDVLIMGDFHIRNLLYEKHEDGRIGDRLVAAIDFQHAKCGSPVFDLANFLKFSISHELRRQHENDFLLYYYNEIKSLANERFPLTFHQLCYLYKRMSAVQALEQTAWSNVAVTVLTKGNKCHENIILDRIKACFDDYVHYLFE